MGYQPPKTFEKDIAIVESNIAAECLSQSSNFWRYAEAAVMARKKVQRLTDALNLLKAELDNDYRRDMTDTGIKFTEAVVSAAITTDPKYQKNLNELREWESIKDTYETAVRAFSQRKDMLDNLVKLQIAGLYSAPEATSEHIREKLNLRELVKKRVQEEVVF